MMRAANEQLPVAANPQSTTLSAGSDGRGGSGLDGCNHRPSFASFDAADPDRVTVLTTQDGPNIGVLSERVAIVTSGSRRGVGRAIAEELAAEGARMMVVARSGEDA
jgi:hypothetical protein